MGEPEEPLLGTCPGLCPAREEAERRLGGRLHRLERGPGGRAVKEFVRPAAGKPRPPPEELRPPEVLLEALRFLLGEWVQRHPRVPPAERGAFVADRLRALRLDLALQRLSGRPCAAPILERALVCLLPLGPRLCAQPGFDAPLHRAQERETLHALRRAYRLGGLGGCPSQPRFQALFLLYHLGSPEALWEILQLPRHIRASPEVSVALEIHHAYLERNFARLFRRARELPYLLSCAFHQHVASVRRMALLTFSHGFSAKNCRYPLDRLVELLALDSFEEAVELCRAHGLEVVDNNVVFQKGSFKGSGPLEQRPAGLLVDQKWKNSSTMLEFAEAVCS